MSKPPPKRDEDNVSSGSDTESESEEDEDTVSRCLNRCNFTVLYFLTSV